jgi:cell division protein FtsI (penicillin-binding protein 3)
MNHRVRNTAPLSKAAWNPIKESLSRMLLLKIALLLFFAMVALRLVDIQVIESSMYQDIAKRQYESTVILPAERGNIYDHNGKILASNSMHVSFGADPQIVGSNAADVAERFARVFGESKSSYLAKLTDKTRRFVWLERRVKPEIAQRVGAADLEGVIQLNEPKRIYHYETVAGQLLGFTDVDNKGIGGIELQFDAQLRGTDGYVIMQRDGLGRRRPSVDYPRIDPVNGEDIVLTIDLEYQSIAESELRRGIERNKAEGGLVVMLEPATGAILAMANYPGIDPNNIMASNAALFKNRAITDMFEPGSVFKIVAASAAIENSLVKLDQRFFAENGTYHVKLADGEDRPITDTHPYGMLTFQEAIEHSSNIVVAKVSDQIGAELLYKTARNYGFGIATGVELPGEVNGELKKPSQWSGATLNSMAIGYEVGVTPMQIAAAYAAVANNGVLMKPFMVKRELGQNNEVIAETRPQQIRKVISKSTAQLLTKIFRGVVERGTGASARHDNVSVAGKTGTSRKFIDGRYESGNYTASFVGYLPAEDPRVLCLVMLDHPKEGGYTGGFASAPIFKAIAEKIVVGSSWSQKTERGVITEKQTVVVPDVVGLGIEVATSMLSSSGFDVQLLGSGKVVLKQSPSFGTRTRPGTAVKISTSNTWADVPTGFTVVPDVRRMSIRRAINRLAMAGLGVSIAGSGVVVGQAPVPGQQVKVGTRVSLKCEPKSLGFVALN